jgi:hypothetical protein
MENYLSGRPGNPKGHEFSDSQTGGIPRNYTQRGSVKEDPPLG